MDFKVDKSYISSEGRINITMARAGILSGFLIYALFGILDPFMVPINYHRIWMIRFAFVAPAVFITYILSYTSGFKNYAKPLLKTLLFLGEIGILAMIYISKPSEGAFMGYYTGLILIILWSGFIFRFNFTESLFYFISTLLLYNIIAITKQNILSFPSNSLEFGAYLGNNFFLTATGLLSLTGANHLEQYFNEIKQKNKQLKNEQSALKKAKEKAEESDRLKTAFLTNMSHEIRTPMNGIVGFSALYMDEESTPEEKEKYAHIVINSSKQLLRIVNDILDLSKIETNQVYINKTTKNIQKELLNIKHLFENRFKSKNINLNLNFPKEEPCFLHTDHTRLFQILCNLLENAYKFTPEGSIEFGYSLDKDTIIFHVKDTGIGIPENYQEIIFDRFRQLENSQTKEFSGTGLGLSISKHLVELLGGNIWLESKENIGTQFFISLPRICNEPNSVTKKQIERKLNTKGIKHILIAEDEDHNFILLKTYLKNSNLIIGHAFDGNEAIEYTKEHPNIDLILMDIKMPKLNGIDAMRNIKKDYPHIPIIAQTAFVMAEDKEKLMTCGFDDYIPKPIESKALFNILNNYLSN